MIIIGNNNNKIVENDDANGFSLGATQAKCNNRKSHNWKAFMLKYIIEKYRSKNRTIENFNWEAHKHKGKKSKLGQIILIVNEMKLTRWL